MAENQAILLTAPGAAAIAVLRLHGPGVQDFLHRRFSRGLVQGRCIHGELRDDSGGIIDDPVIVLLDPTTADVNLHGGSYVIQATLDQCRGEGFTVVDRLDAPLPRDAVDATDPIDSEMLQHLPSARTELALQVLLAQPLAWQQLQDGITAGQIGPDKIQQIVRDRSLHWLLSLPRVAIIGPANVGKSTLANQLFNQQRSITADLPGTTRDWVGEIANIHGLAVMLIDTPGLRGDGEMIDPIERAALDASQPQITAADLVVVVLDASAPLPPQTNSLLAQHRGGIVVANKSDQCIAWSEAEVAAIPTVATTGKGMDAVTAAILRHFDCENLKIDQARCWTEAQRHKLRSLL